MTHGAGALVQVTADQRASFERGSAMTSAGTAEVALKNILFATDFSLGANKAEPFLGALARRFGSKVQLVHVVELSAAFKTPDAGICIDAFRKSGAENLARAQTRLTATGVETEAILTEGIDAAKQILQVANENAADLIVGGTRGQGSLARLALGSVAEHLIYHAICPVLTVGPNVKPLAAGETFKQIICATDFSTQATHAVKFAMALAQSYGAHMFLCHVLPRSDGSNHIDVQQLTGKFQADLRALIPESARQSCEPECVVDHGYAADGILLLARRVKSDLIILGTHRSSHWFANLKTGIAFEVTRTAACPVLTLRG